MSKARNISNLFSSNTDISTDAELNTHATAANGHTSRGNTSSRPGSASQGDTYFNTELGLLEVYDTGRWTTANVTPVAPSSVVATDQPTGRAYNNGQASIAFTAPTTGGRVNTYTVTSSPGSYTNTGSSSPIVLTGLQSSTQYTYSITSTNGVGTSASSESSSGVTATTVPQAPTIGTATGGSQSATLTFTAGSTGGATISNYKYSTDNSTYTAFSPAQTTSPLTISGLTDGTSYSFYLKAVNSNGDSTASSASNSVTPSTSAAAFESIATVSISSDTNTITFSSIPTTYKHLQIRGVVRCNYNNSSTGASAFKIQFNGDTGANYSFHAFQGNGSTASSNATSSTNQMLGVAPWANAGAFGAGVLVIPVIIDIMDYKDTNKNKVINIFDGFNTNTTSTNQHIGLRSGAWYNTSAVNSIMFDATAGPFSDGPFAANTKFSLYGIKG